MSYQKNTWEHLDRVTAEKMNNMEEGIAAADSAAALAQETADEAVSRCLPTPTSADIGKVATVVGETSKGAVIVPEQSVTVSKVGATLTDADASLFVDGASVIVTIDGAEYLATVETVDSITVIAVEGYADAKNLFVNEYDGALIASGTSNTITLSINLASISVAYGLEAPSSGGGDNIFIVNATFDYDDVNDEWSVALDKTFAEISAASNAGKIVLCIPYESASGATGYPCVMTVETTEAYTSTDVEPNDGTVYSLSFGIDNNDDTNVEATTWSKGGGGALVVNDVDGTLDKTWQEIHDAMLSGGAVLQFNGNEDYVSLFDAARPGKSAYVVSASGSTYSSSTKSGYPTKD